MITPRQRRLLLLLILAIVVDASPLLSHENSQSVQQSDLSALSDQVIDVQLSDDTYVVNATVIEITKGKLENSLRSIKVQTPQDKRPVTVPASRIKEIFIDEDPLDVIYDRKNRCLVFSPEERLDRLEHHRIVATRLEASRNRYWKPLTEQANEEFMVEHRQFLEEVEAKMPTKTFRLVETDYFLFYTDLTSAEVDGYIVYLDAMYRELCKAFGLSPDKNIWCGKCVVIAFRNERDYQQFEALIMDNFNSAGTQGLCHQFSDGKVIFAGFKGDNDHFGHVLVHETSHGFVHRYLTTARAPSWLNEGMADWLADVIVKGDSISRRQRGAALVVRQQGGWGNFLTTDQIGAEYYGSASTLVQILLKVDRGGQFRDFFTGIKEGKLAEESLKDSFGISYQDLEILYARQIANVK